MACVGVSGPQSISYLTRAGSYCATCQESAASCRDFFCSFRISPAFFSCIVYCFWHFVIVFILVVQVSQHDYRFLAQLESRIPMFEVRHSHSGMAAPSQPVTAPPTSSHTLNQRLEEKDFDFGKLDPINNIPSQHDTARVAYIDNKKKPQVCLV